MRLSRLRWRLAFAQRPLPGCRLRRWLFASTRRTWPRGIRAQISLAYKNLAPLSQSIFDSLNGRRRIELESFDFIARHKRRHSLFAQAVTNKQIGVLDNILKLLLLVSTYCPDRHFFSPH